MTFKTVLVAAASVLSVSPAFALTRSQIIHHSGGPIPYSELTSPSSSSSGYNVRSSRRHHRRARTGQSEAANTSTAPGATGSASTGYNSNLGATAPGSSVDNSAANAGAAPSPTPGAAGSAGVAGSSAAGATTPSSPTTTPGSAAGSATGSAGATTSGSSGGATPQ